MRRHRQWAPATIVVALACLSGMLCGTALATPPDETVAVDEPAHAGEVVYLEVADLLYDPSADVLIDPDSGAVIEYPRPASSALRLQELVDSDAWSVPEALRDEALSLLFEEIAILVQLDAFADPSVPFERIHTVYRPVLDEDRHVLIAALVEVDHILDAVKGDLLAHVQLPRGPATDALGDLPNQWKRGLERGTVGAVMPEPYSQALSMLLSRGTAGKLGPGDAGIEFLALAPALDTLAFPRALAELMEMSGGATPLLRSRLDAALAADAPAPRGVTVVQTSSRGWGIVTIVLAGVAGLALFALMWTRRRHRIEGGVVDISETVRALINARTEQDVAQLSIGEAVRLTGAHSGFLLRTDGSHVRCATSATPVETAVATVALTAVPMAEVLHGDPVLGELPAGAVLAVPVMSGGDVVAILGVRNAVDRAFGHRARAELDRLAPSVADALANVDRLGSLAELALVDDLTRLGNRRRLDRDLQVALDRSTEVPVAFAMVDVDHFKHFNDTNGHAAGDEALRTVAAIIAANVRQGDVVYRYGGEEFSILLPHATLDEAARVAERVRLAVEGAPVSGEHSQPEGRLTVSVGVSAHVEHGPECMTRRADRALYEAKQAGRNNVRSSVAVS